MLLHLLFFFIQENVFLKNFLIGRKLLFTVVLVSAVRQSYISPSSSPTVS